MENQVEEAQVKPVPAVKAKKELYLLEWMIGLGFITFIFLACYNQGMFHVKPLEPINPIKIEEAKPEGTDVAFAWDETSVLI